MIGGYSMLDLASPTIYKEAVIAAQTKKPVMVYDLPDVYFADTIKTTTIDGDDVVQITKGGKTITINDANAVSSEGDFVNHLYEHNITLTISVTGDSETDLYLTFKTLNNVSDTMDLNAVKSYINKFDWGADEVLNCNAFGERTYIGITYDGEDVYKVLSGYTEYTISDMSLYYDKVIQIQ